MAETLPAPLPSAQADGSPDTLEQVMRLARNVPPTLAYVKRRPQLDPKQTAIDELTAALIRAVAVKQHLADPEQIPVSAYQHFRRIAGVAIHLAYSGDTAALKAEVLRDLADDDDCDILGPEVRIGRKALGLFCEALWLAGEREVRA